MVVVVRGEINARFKVGVRDHARLTRMATLERPREAESSTYVTSLGPAPSLPAFPSDLVHPRRPSQSAGPLTNGAIGGQELEEAVSNGLEIPVRSSAGLLKV